MSPQEIKAFFIKLMEECGKDTAYSVIETATNMGVKYEQLQEWAKSDELLTEMLEECRFYCANNAEMAGITKKISFEKFAEHMCENDDEFKMRYEKQKQEEWLAEKERKGEEIIEETSVVIEDSNNKTGAEPKDLINAEWWKNREVVEEERVNQWREKQAKNNSGFSYKKLEGEGNDVNLGLDFMDKNLTPDKQQELYRSTLCAATGSASNEFAHMIFAQTAGGFFKSESNISDNSKALIEALLALKPRDEVEGMLISRILVLHNQYMEFMRRASGPTQTTAGVDMNINRATKLMRAYDNALESLSRYRRKGQQQITVQHVNVSDGGQAIIGSVEAGGGDKRKNQRSTPCQ